MRRKITTILSVTVGILLLLVIINPFLLLGALVASGYYEGMRGDTPFEDAHRRAVTTFVKSEGFGISRARKTGLWNERTVTYEGHTYQPYEIRLVGVTPEFGPRLFSESHPPEKEQITYAQSRTLTAQELKAIERLGNRVSVVEELPSSKTGHQIDFRRIVAPIFASSECLGCHSVEVGEMLGAFDYLLIPQFEY